MSLILPVISAVLKSITLVNRLGNENGRLNADIQGGLRSISQELGMIQSSILEEKYEDLHTPELVYDIEDFVDRLWIPGKTAGFFLSPVGIDPRPADIDTINHYMEDIKSVQAYVERERIRHQSQSGTSSSAGPAPPSYTPEEDLVGFRETKDDILKLLFAPAHDEQVKATNDMQLRVISIVGCRGLGKTALARAVYNDPTASVAGAFHCKAWVVMPKYKEEIKNLSSEIVEENLKKSVEDILKNILEQVRSSFKKKDESSAPSSSNNKEDVSTVTSSQSTSEALRSFLMRKRYLVCIDDVQHKEVWDEFKEVWDKIEMLSENDMGSRILVTTNVHSIADGCSWGGYVYKMLCLDRANSEKLFWSKAIGPSNVRTDAVALGSESIFDKCDGLPLALISAGKYLKGNKPLMPECERVGKKLGDLLAGNETRFAEMKRVIVHCYSNLPDYSHKNCLVYASIFPRGHQINIKSIARKLVAEELIDNSVSYGIQNALDFVLGCLKELINQSMIEKVLADDDSKIVERCKVQSIILEFFIRMALSKNFVTLIDKRGTNIIHHSRARNRRLVSVQSATKARRSGLPEDIDQSTVRSLTIINGSLSVKKKTTLKRMFLQRAPVCFKKCKVLRILDLEGCTGIDNGVLDDICGLVLLKYLGLRKTDVKELPKNIENLRNLETLDMRETRVTKLSMKVIMLPVLAYLFGKFELQPFSDGQEGLTDFLSTKSKLHTLAGIVIGGTSNGFEVVIQYAQALKKVKIWCKNTPAPTRSFPVLFLHKLTSGLAYGNLSVGSSDPGRSSQDPAPSTAPVTPAPEAGGSPGPNACVRRLADALGKRDIDIGLESLFIDFNGVSNDFLSSLDPASTISSIKVRRGSGTLPDSAMLQEIRNINKLHLFSAGHSIEELAALQSLPCLQYLKLADDGNESWTGNFHVEHKGFDSLLWLCFEAKKYPRIRIEDGGMEHLASLLLLCPESPPQIEGPKMEEVTEIEKEEEIFGVNGISHLAQLNEVVLHHSAPVETILAAWKRAANLHMNKPYVKTHPPVKKQTNSGAVEQS